MSTFFTADTHFAHQNIIKYCNRPFKTYREMDETLIANWNSVVKTNDLVWHLGDFAYGRDATPDYLSSVAWRLNGNINLILGNHDEKVKDLLSRFNKVYPNPAMMDGTKDKLNVSVETEINGQRIVMFHYGMRTWHHDLREVWHLFGHSHGGLGAYGKSCDIGVDCWNFTPVEFRELKRYMDARPIGDHPGFKDYVPAENK